MEGVDPLPSAWSELPKDEVTGVPLPRVIDFDLNELVFFCGTWFGVKI